MALPPSTANWHWKNKNVTRWGKEWFERELCTLSVKGDAEGELVSISKVTDVEGDVELGQRKSKLITIYDCKLELEWTGTASDGTTVEGKISIPEVSHEITIDGLSDYQYTWTLTTASTPAVNALFDLAKSHLRTALETKFAEFPTAIIDTHGKDLTISADPSRSGTPAPPTAPPPASFVSASAAPTAPSKSTPKGEPITSLNTTRVAIEATFMAAAADLFSLLTDEKRIPSWTRSPAQSKAEAGGEYALFGGGVKGKYVSLTPPKTIVQSWALQSPTWPSGHVATLTTTLEESTDSTKVKFSLDGVPTGLEDEIHRNLDGYYIHGLKAIGYVQLVPSHPSSYVTSRPKQTSPSNETSDNWTPYVATAMVIMVLVAALTIPLLSPSS